MVTECLGRCCASVRAKISIHETTNKSIVVILAISYTLMPYISAPLDSIMKTVRENPIALEQLFPAGFKPTTFIEATVIGESASGNNTYGIDLKPDWCIGLGMNISLIKRISVS